MGVGVAHAFDLPGTVIALAALACSICRCGCYVPAGRTCSETASGLRERSADDSQPLLSPHTSSPGKYAGHLTERGYNAVNFYGTTNCWARDLRILNPDSGVLASKSDFVTAAGQRPVEWAQQQQAARHWVPPPPSQALAGSEPLPAGRRTTGTKFGSSPAGDLPTGCSPCNGVVTPPCILEAGRSACPLSTLCSAGPQTLSLTSPLIGQRPTATATRGTTPSTWGLARDT